MKKYFLFIAFLMFSSCTNSPPEEEIVNTPDFDVKNNFTCTPISKEYCESGACDEMVAEVWIEVDVSTSSTSRCDTKGCDFYAITFQESGNFTNIYRPDEGGWFVKIDQSTGEYTETATLGLGSYISYGKCENNESSVAKSLTESISKDVDVAKISDAYISVHEVDSVNVSDNGAFYVYGETSNNCTEVFVQASNEVANLYDNYKLGEYTYGDTSFRYGIRSDWNNLAEGSNTYHFTAYCDGDQVTSEVVAFTYTEPTTNYTAPVTPYSYEDTSNNVFEDAYVNNESNRSTSSYFNTIKKMHTSAAYIIGNCNDEYEFLGDISGKYDTNSIFSKYGDHGSKYSDSSIWNKYGDYGGNYSDCSAFNKYASSPPMILIGDDIVAYLSQNKYAGGTVIAPNELLLYAYQEFDDDHWLDLVRD